MHFSVTTTTSMKFPLDPRHKLFLTHCHVARRTPHYPQFLLNFPKLPAEDASQEDKDAYGAFVLSLFMAWTSDNGFVHEIVGVNPWEQYLTWRRTLPRGLLDRRAVEMLDNATLQTKARAFKDRNPKVRACLLCSVRRGLLFPRFCPCPQFVRSIRMAVQSGKASQGTQPAKRSRRLADAEVPKGL